MSDGTSRNDDAAGGGYELDVPERPAAPAPTPPAATAPAPARPAPGPEAGPRPPLVRTGRYDLPLLGAGVAAALFVVGCLAGLASLFPQFGAAETDVWVRANTAVRGVLLIGIGSACLVTGLLVLVFLDGRPTGDVRVVAMRCAMIAAVALLARAVPMPFEFLKATWDVAGPLAIAFLLLMGLFRLPARDATTALGASLIVLVLLSIASLLVSFATGAPAGPAEQVQRSTIS